MAGSFVKLDSYWSLDEATLAKMHLESEGIYVALEGANLVAATWGDANAIGGVKLFVKEADAERARELLDTKCNSEDLEQAIDSEWAADTDAGHSNWQTDDLRQGDQDDERSSGSKTINDVRTMKRPIAMLLLAPIFFAFVLPLLMMFLFSILRLVG